MTRWTLPLAALVGVLLGAVGMFWWQANGFGGGAPSRAGTERTVRAYLLSHPEVLEQALQGVQDLQTGRVVALHRDEITRPFGGAWAGNPRGDVTLVEYFDYNCGYCRAVLPTVETLLRRDAGLRVVYRELPILSPQSLDAARVSLAAAAQGRFARFHQALYTAGPVTPATIAAAATSAGVDPSRVPAAADEELARNRAVVGAIGGGGTPTWVVGNRVLSGAQSLDALEAAVAAARSQARG